MKIANSVADLVGNTPLVRINRAAQGSRAKIVAKLEFYSPARASRTASGLDDRGRRARRQDRPDTVIVEPTSGNTGIALAWVCAVKATSACSSCPSR
jgi:cysteine synthase A